MIRSTCKAKPQALVPEVGNNNCKDAPVHGNGILTNKVAFRMSSPSRLLKGRQKAPLPCQYGSSTCMDCSTPDLEGSPFSCPTLHSSHAPFLGSPTYKEQLNDLLMDIVKLTVGNEANQGKVFQVIETAVRKLLKADRASLFLLDPQGQELHAHVFSVSKEESKRINTVTLEHTASCFKDYINNLGRKPIDVVAYKGTRVSLPIDKGIVGYVARTGKPMIVSDTAECEHFCTEFDSLTGYKTETLLCVPLVINEKIIGVLEAVNKKGGLFSKVDESLLESIALLCGLYLNDSHLKKECQRLENKYQVANEMLQYHRQCTDEHFQQIQTILTPSVEEYDIGNFAIDTATIPDNVKVHLVVTMISDLVGNSLFNSEQLLKFSLTVSKNYRPKPYHNWDHAFHVAQCMYCILKGAPQHFSEIERFALVLSCLCHDLDHRAFNNAFLVSTSHPLSQLYSSSIMENHHFSQTIELLQMDGLNIFSLLTESQYQKVLETMQKAILATDLVNFFQNKGDLSKIIDTGKFSWDSPKHKELVKCLMMTVCDLCCACKPWDIHVQSVEAIFEEFYTQGDVERSRGMSPIEMLDRNFKHKLPFFQVGFIEGITQPCCQLLKLALPHLNVLLETTASNKKKWQNIIDNQ